MTQLGLHWSGHGALFLMTCHLLARLIKNKGKKILATPVGLSAWETKQVFFAECVARFIPDARALGYSATFGEAWRSPETCALYAKEGKGIVNSLHTQRLAIDLNFFKDGKLICSAEEYTPLGRLWESYSTQEMKCTAGVFFKTRVDSDHFSLDEI